MKNKLKGLVLGVAIGTMLTGATAYAGTSTKLNVVLENVKLMFDGVQKETTRSIIYNGQMYVPAKTMAEGMGEQFSYDGKTKTAWVGKKHGSFKYLSDMSYARVDARNEWYLTFNKDYNGGAIAIGDGEQFKYKKGISGKLLSNTDYANPSSVTYNLNGKYKKLSGFAGIDDATRNYKGTMDVVIIGDGTELARFEGIKGGDNPRNVDVDITGVVQLKILFEATSDSTEEVWGVLAEAKVIQ